MDSMHHEEGQRSYFSTNIRSMPPSFPSSAKTKPYSYFASTPFTVEISKRVIEQKIHSLERNQEEIKSVIGGGKGLEREGKDRKDSAPASASGEEVREQLMQLGIPDIEMD